MIGSELHVKGAVGSSKKGSLAILALAWFACLLGGGFLARRLWSESIDFMDFRYIWLAGDLWARGLNPYGPEYIAAGAARFTSGYPISAWAYPFHWYLPARAAALLPPEQAFALWLGVTTALLAGAGWLALGAARAFGLKPSLSLILFGIGFAASSSAVNYALRTGQPAVLAACGIACCLFGVAHGKRWWTVLGLVVTMLKPQFGLPFAAALCFMPGGLATVALAAVGTLIACVPAFLSSGVTEQIHGLLVLSRGSYQQISYNTADMMPGLPRLVELVSPWSMSITVSMLVAAAASALAMFALRRRPAPERALMFITLTCAITTALVGLHPYDLIIIMFTLPFLGKLSLGERVLAIAGFAIFWRAESLSPIFHGSASVGPTVESGAMLLILAAWLLRAKRYSASQEWVASSDRISN